MAIHDTAGADRHTGRVEAARGVERGRRYVSPTEFGLHPVKIQTWRTIRMYLGQSTVQICTARIVQTRGNHGALVSRLDRRLYRKLELRGAIVLARRYPSPLDTLLLGPEGEWRES